MFGGQFIGDCSGWAACDGLAFITQLAADLADRAHGVNAFLVFSGAVIDDLRINLTGYRR